MAHHRRSFKFCSAKLPSKICQVTSFGTVLESLQSSSDFRKIVNGCTFVIQREKNFTDGIIAEHFPSDLIENEEKLTIHTFPKNVKDENKGAKVEDENVQYTGSLSEAKGAGRELVTFTVHSKGGQNTMTKLIVRYDILKKFETLCVYAYKDETIKSALLRDGRFADTVFQEGCKLQDIDSKDLIEINQYTSCLNELAFEITLPRQKNTKSTNIQNQPCGSGPKTERTTARKGETEVTKSTINKEPRKTSQKKPSSNPHYEEIWMILQEQYSDLVKIMEGRNRQKYPKLTKEDFVKKTQPFTKLSQLEKLVMLSRSVGRVVVGDCHGTGFLFFDNFILTNAHVIEENYNSDLKQLTNRASINFDLGNERPLNKDLPLSSVVIAVLKGRDWAGRYVDFALLKLQDKCEEISELPRLLHVYTPRQDVQGICIIGHPGAMEKRMDVSCIVPHKATGSEAGNSIQFFYKMDINYSEFQVIGEQSFIATYNTCFLKGASGSPVFDEDCRLVAMHTGGFFTDLKKEHVIEFGIPVHSIIYNIIDQLHLREEILIFIEEAKKNLHLYQYLQEFNNNLKQQQSTAGSEEKKNWFQELIRVLQI